MINLRNENLAYSEISKARKRKQAPRPLWIGYLLSSYMPAYFFLFQHIIFYYYLCFVRIPLGELILVAAEIAFHGDGDARKSI